MSQSLVLSVQRFQYDSSLSLQEVQEEFQRISTHSNLSPYIHVLGSSQHNTAHAISLQYIHTLHHELLFCLKHNQHPTKHRIALMYHSICDALLHLHTSHQIVHAQLTPHRICMNSRNVFVTAYMHQNMMQHSVAEREHLLHDVSQVPDEHHEQTSLFLRHSFHALHHKNGTYNFNIIYRPPDYFVAHLNGIDLEVRYDLDTWAVAVILMFYVLGRSFLDTFVLETHNSAQETDTPHTLDDPSCLPKHVNPLLFYSHIQQFRMYFTERAVSTSSDTLSQRKRELFEASYSRLKSTLSTTQLNFIMEGIRPTNRPSVSQIYSPPTTDTDSTTPTSLGSTTSVPSNFPLSSRHSNFIPLHVRCSQLPPATTDGTTTSTQSSSADIVNVDEKVQNNLTDMYFTWISQNSTESVIQFFESRLSLKSTQPLFNYPSIRHSNSVPHSTLSQVSDPSLLDGAIGSVFINPLQQNSEYHIPASFFTQWATNSGSSSKKGDANHSTNGGTTPNRKRPNPAFHNKDERSESEIHHDRVRQFSCLADVNGDLIKYKTKDSYSFSQMLTDQEQNLRHQHQRVELFRSLITEYPSTQNRIISEARKDIPPVLRGEIWACVLGVDVNYEELYERIIWSGDTSGTKRRSRSATFTTDCDRQISVDVPRCHQYHSKLNCEQGRKKLEILLRAWTKYHDGALVYWQGLDSLCAPFVVLNYYDEALAFSCLLKLVDKYVQQFFQENNSNAMEYQLCMFEKLLSYHEPQIAHHMDIIGFKPELYTIPWFLTLFAHVLPIEKIFKLWDHILLDTHLLPLHIAVSFLKQQRSELLHSDFNEMMGVLTNMHHINIEKVIEDSYALQQKTPNCVLDPKCLQFLPTREYKELKYPRITADDLCSTDLYQIALIIDVQHPHNYAKRHCTKAYHISPVRQKKSKVAPDEWLMDYEIDESDLSLLKSNVLHYLQYKRGIPIVLISDHSKIEQQVERHLLRHNYPYVSIVFGGMHHFTHVHQQFIVHSAAMDGGGQ